MEVVSSSMHRFRLSFLSMTMSPNNLEVPYISDVPKLPPHKRQLARALTLQWTIAQSLLLAGMVLQVLDIDTSLICFATIWGD